MGKKHLFVSSIKGYCFMLHCALKYPEISSSIVLRDLLGSFESQRTTRSSHFIIWDLVLILEKLMTGFYEPLGDVHLKTLSKETRFSAFSCLY